MSKDITLIPARRKIGQSKSQNNENPKLKVAAYCRVSTDSEEQSMGLEKDVPFLLQTELEKQGARFVKGSDFDSHTVVDRNFVTGQNPNSSEEVAEKIVNVLKK